MVNPERQETKGPMELPSRFELCSKRYNDWLQELLVEDGSNHRLVTSEFWNEITQGISPEISSKLNETLSIEERINSYELDSVSKRNSEREKVIEEVLGENPFSSMDEKVARRLRSATIDIFIALQQHDGASALEESLAPRVWHYLKDEVIRGLYNVDHLNERLETEKGGKLASVSPLEFAYTIDLLR